MSSSRRAIAPDFDRLFAEEYVPLAKSLSLSFGFETARDAVQEAFVELGLRWSRVSNYDNPAAWVRRVALNRAISAQRRLGRQTPIEGQDVQHSDDEAKGRHLDAAVSARIDLARALKTLPERQRLAMTLFYVGDYTVAEVAQTLGVSDGTIKSQLHDARHNMQRLLGQEYQSA